VIRYLSLAEYVWLAEQVTGIEAAVLAKAARIDLADSALHPRPALTAKSSTPTSSTRRRSSPAGWPGTTLCPTGTSGLRGLPSCSSSI
jgi:hypothetical protein